MTPRSMDKAASRVSDRRLAELLDEQKTTTGAMLAHPGFLQQKANEWFSILAELQSLRSLSDSVSDGSKGVAMDREWFERRAAIEGDLEVGVGYSTVNPTPRDLAAYSEIALKALPQWAQNEIRKARTLDSGTGGPGVRVRPLEWKENLGRGGGYIYEISEPNRTPGWRVWVKPNMGMQSVIGGGIITVKAKDRDEAIAVAEADYRFRILSALDSGTGGQRPVAWRGQHSHPKALGKWVYVDGPEKPKSLIGGLGLLEPLYSSPTEPKAGVVEKASIHELEQSVSALEEERQNLIATKRDQISRLVARAESAEADLARARALEKLIDAADAMGTAANMSMADDAIAFARAALPNTTGEAE